MFVVFSNGSDVAAHQHGMVVDPGGCVLADHGSSPGTMPCAIVDPGLIAGSVGQQCLSARRFDTNAPRARSKFPSANAYAERNETAPRGAIALSFAQVSRVRPA